MVAAGHLENASSIGKCSLLDVFHPGAVHAQGNVILRLTRHGASVATDALAVVDNEPVSHVEGQSPIELPSGLGIVSEAPVSRSESLQAIDL